ncbi:MAG: hypothetical protein HY054_02205 [Proteobacteria bacterium]|nr:hypothetical protein [Pseudomonadota bacterium]
MRKALLLSLIWLAGAQVAAAQYDPQSDQSNQAHLNRTDNRNNRSQGGQQGQQGHDTPQPPPPIPRCADLAVTALGFSTSIPGGAPLAAGEVALQYDVHNAGTSMYMAPGGATQTLSLEYTTPSGTHQVASAPLPPQRTGATAAAAGSVTLAQGQSWRGYMRMTLPMEARRWPLRLKLSFAQSNSPYAARISDCDPDNDEVVVPRSQLPPLPAPPS